MDEAEIYRRLGQRIVARRPFLAEMVDGNEVGIDLLHQPECRRMEESLDVVDPSMLVDREFPVGRSEEHTSELQSLMRISYAVFCLKHKKKETQTQSKR